jgi:hypothetical protein
MSSRRRKREMWMWWLTPTCSTLLYYTGKRERKRRRRKKTREWRVYVYTISLFHLSGGWMVSFLSLSIFFFSNHQKKNDHAQLFFSFFSPDELWTTYSSSLFSRASTAMIILLTHSTNEMNVKKNGRSLGMGLASSPLLYEEMKRQRKGNEGIRQEEKKIALSACTVPSSWCLYVAILHPFFLSLSLWHDHIILTTSSSKKRTRRMQYIYIYIRLDRNGSRMMMMIGLLLLTFSSSIHMMPYIYKRKKKKRRDTMAQRIN